MTYTQSNNYQIRDRLETFRSLSVDEQLGLFWFIYKAMGHSITPAAPNASTVSPDVAEGLFNQVKELSHEEQLQLQRDLINKVDNQYSRMYGSMSDTTKLLFWYRLSQGMENATIIPMPDDYQLSDQAQLLLGQIEIMDFEQQITLFRDYVAPMGTEPKQGAEI